MSFQNIQQALEAFLQSDNNLRKSAEEFLNNIPKTNFDAGIDQFLQGMDIQNEQIAQLSALYLKKKYLDDESMLQRLNEASITKIITKVQESVNDQKTFSYLQRSFEILVKLYSFAKKEEMIMNLIQSLAQNSQESKIKRALMYMIEITCEYSFDDDLLIKHANSLSEIFSKYLEDSDINVRVSAFKGLTVFLAAISNESLVKQFSSVFPLLLSKCIEALKEDSESGQKNLESLVDLSETHPKFIRPILNDLVNLYTEIIQNQQFTEAIRIQAFNGITVLCSTAPSLIRKCEIFKTNTTKAIMMVMTEIDGMDVDEWNKELNDELLSQQHPSIMAIETLGKIGPELGVKFLLPIFIPMIKEAILSNEWKNQHAGLMGISMLSEGCKEVFASELDNIIQMVNSLANSENPRIIQALLKTYALLAEEFNPDVQTRYGDQIIPYITKSLQSNLLKVQYTAVQSIVTFARSLQDSPDEAKIFSQYSKQILDPITSLFQQAVQNNNQLLIEEVLSAISVVAYVLESDFAQYYNIYMPGLNQLLDSIPATNQGQINIRILTIESMGYIISSIKKDTALFQGESAKLMQVLLQMQSTYPADDLHHAAIYVVISQIADGLGQDFNQYWGQIFDRVIQSIDNEDIAKLGNSDSTQDQQQVNTIQRNIDLGMFGNFNFELNHSLLEQKLEGAHLLLKAAKALGKGYFQYVEKTLACVQKHFSYKHSKDFRESCVKTLYYLLLSCETDEQMATIFNASIPHLQKEVELSIENKKAEQIAFILEQIGECLAMFKSPLVQQNFIEYLINKISKSLEIGEKLKNDIRKEYQDEEMDEELQAELDDELDEVNAIMRAAIELIGTSIKVYKTSIEGLVINSLLPHFFSILQSKNALENEIFNALYVFDILMEFCSMEIYNKAYGQLINLYVQIPQTEAYNTTDVLLNIISGFSVFAQRTEPSQFKQHLDQALKIIQSVIENPKNQEEDWINTYEAAIGAIGRIGLFQLQDNQQLRDQVIQKYLQCLPLKHDSDEAQASHKLLLEQCIQQNQALVGNPELVKQALQNINTQNQSNPESEILCDQGKQLLSQVLSN